MRHIQEANPIPLDDVLLDAVVASLVDQVEEKLTKLLVHQPSAPIGAIRLAEKRVKIKDVRGIERELFIKVKSELVNSYTLNIGGKYEPKKHKIVVYLNGVFPAEQAIGMLRGTSDQTFEGAIRSILVHEFTHAHDYLHMKGYQSPIKPGPATKDEQRQAYIDYVNQPDELRAFMQQMVRETLQNAQVLKSYKELDTQRARLKVLLRASSSFQAVGKFLTAQNMKLVLRAVYNAVGDYLKTGKKPRIPGAPKLNPPPAGVTAPSVVKVSSHIKSRFADLELESTRRKWAVLI